MEIKQINLFGYCHLIFEVFATHLCVTRHNIGGEKAFFLLKLQHLLLLLGTGSSWFGRQCLGQDSIYHI